MTQHSENVRYVLHFYFSCDVNFPILVSWKQLFHIAQFRYTCYVQDSFCCLDVSNSVSKWNEGKSRIFVESVFQICQMETPGFIYIIMFLRHSQYLFLYWFFEFNRVSDLKWRRKPHFRWVKNSNMPNGYTVSHIPMYFSEISFFLSFI